MDKILIDVNLRDYTKIKNHYSNEELLSIITKISEDANRTRKHVLSTIA